MRLLKKIKLNKKIWKHTLKLTILFLSWVLDEAFSLWTGPGVLAWDHPVGLRLGGRPVQEGQENETDVKNIFLYIFMKYISNILTQVLTFWGILLEKEKYRRVFIS